MSSALYLVFKSSRLAKPIGTKVTHRLHIDDPKVYSSSEVKRRSSNSAMHWNPKKYNVPLGRESQMRDAADLKLDQTAAVESLKAGSI